MDRSRQIIGIWGNWLVAWCFSYEQTQISSNAKVISVTSMVTVVLREHVWIEDNQANGCRKRWSNVSRQTVNDFKYRIIKTMVIVVLQRLSDVRQQTTRNFKYEDDTSRPGSKRMIREKHSTASQRWSDVRWLIIWITLELKTPARKW